MRRLARLVRATKSHSAVAPVSGSATGDKSQAATRHNKHRLRSASQTARYPAGQSWLRLLAAACPDSRKPTILSCSRHAKPARTTGLSVNAPLRQMPLNPWARAAICIAITAQPADISCSQRGTFGWSSQRATTVMISGARNGALRAFSIPFSSWPASRAPFSSNWLKRSRPSSAIIKKRHGCRCHGPGRAARRAVYFPAVRPPGPVQPGGKRFGD